MGFMLHNSKLKLNQDIIKKGLGSIFIRIGSIVLGIISSVLIARFLGPSNFGIYNYVLSFIILVNVPAQLGLPQFIVRQVSQFRAQKDWQRIRGIFIWGSKTILTFSIIVLSIFALTIFYTHDSYNVEMAATFKYGLFLIPLLAFIAFLQAVLRGLKYTLIGQLPEMIIRRFVFVLVVVFLILYQMDYILSPSVTMLIQTVATISALLITILFLIRYVPQEVKTCTAVLENRNWLKGLIPFFFIGGMQVINNNSDIVMLGLLRSSTEVGYYKVAVQISTLVTLPLQAINLVAAPRFAELWIKQDKKKLQELATTSARSVAVFSIPLIIIFVSLGGLIIKLMFGEIYMKSLSQLHILLFGQTITVFMGLVGRLLNMTGYEKKAAFGLTVAALTNILLNLILIPLFGANGAAVASSVSYLIWNFYLGYSVWRLLGIDSTILGVYRYIGNKI